MVRVTRFLMAVSAATMAIAPAVAAPVAPSSVRAAADNDEASALAGAGGILIALGAVAAIVVALIVVGDNDAEDAPTSP